MGEGKEARETAEAVPEYLLRAAFLYNFAKYVEWPPSAFERPDYPITIGIVGRDPFGDDLDKALKSKTVKNRTFSILRFPRASDIKRCQVLYVARSEVSRLDEIFERVRPWSVLTVGEDEDFTRSGGTIAIVLENDRLKLVINPDAAEKSGLTIDAKLLKASRIVRTRGRP